MLSQWSSMRLRSAGRCAVAGRASPNAASPSLATSNQPYNKPAGSSASTAVTPSARPSTNPSAPGSGSRNARTAGGRSPAEDRASTRSHASPGAATAPPCRSQASATSARTVAASAESSPSTSTRRAPAARKASGGSQAGCTPGTWGTVKGAP